MNVIIFIILALYLINNTFVFRFQRTTLSISRELFKQDYSRVQALMTPSWLGVLGWLNTGLIIILSILFWSLFGWIYTVLFLTYAFIGTGIVYMIVPYPSYKFCFKIIKVSLKKDLSRSPSEEGKVLKEMLEKVENIEFEYLVNQH